MIAAVSSAVSSAVFSANQDLLSNLSVLMRTSRSTPTNRSGRSSPGSTPPIPPVSGKNSIHSSGRTSPSPYASMSYSPPADDVSRPSGEYRRLNTWCGENKVNTSQADANFKMTYPSTRNQVKIQLGLNTVLEFENTFLNCRLARLCLTCACMGDVLEVSDISRNFKLLIESKDKLGETDSPALKARIKGFDHKEGPG
jgi:hypothetical protein